VFFKQVSLAGFVIALAASLLLLATARADEAECLRFFGSAYRDYARTTRRFIPRVF
jgi:protein-S-isoprenylcysteine O-methyltransferase Ste14